MSKHTHGKFEIIKFSGGLGIQELNPRKALLAIIDTTRMPEDEIYANARLIKNASLALDLLKEASQVILSEVPKNNSGVRALLDRIDTIIKEIES